MNAFKRPRKDAAGALTQSATYYIRFEFKGKSILKKTPFTNKDDALAHARALRATLDKQDWAALRQFNRSPLPAPQTQITIAHLLETYRAKAGPVREITDPKTIAYNTHALRKILIRAAGLDPSQLTPEQKQLYDQTPLAKLNANLIDAFKADTIARAADLNDDAAQSLYRSANSYLRAARSILGKELRDAYRRAGLILPDLTEFLEVPDFERVAKSEYHPASDTLLHKTFTSLEEPNGLRQTDPDAYAAVWLALGFGLRRAEIAFTQVQNFLHLAGIPHISLTKKTKNKTIAVTIQCQLDAWPRLAPIIAARRAAEGPAAYILTGTFCNRTDETFDRVAAWMQALGWQTQKMIHEFRAYAGSKIAEDQGMLAARDFLRHKDSQTTERFYGRYIRVQIRPVPLRIPTIESPQLLPLDKTQAIG